MQVCEIAVPLHPVISFSVINYVVSMRCLTRVTQLIFFAYPEFHGYLEQIFQVDFPRHDRHKADRAALGLSCGVCFEALACVFASAGARLMLVDMEEYRLRQTFVHRKVDYMHSMAY